MGYPSAAENKPMTTRVTMTITAPTMTPSRTSGLGIRLSQCSAGHLLDASDDSMSAFAIASPAGFERVGEDQQGVTHGLCLSEEGGMGFGRNMGRENLLTIGQPIAGALV